MQDEILATLFLIILFLAALLTIAGLWEICAWTLDKFRGRQ